LCAQNDRHIANIAEYYRTLAPLINQDTMMKNRLDYTSLSDAAVQQYMAFSTTTKQNPFIANIAHLVTIRASQLNGCAFCLDMHVKEARIHGERDLRVHHIAVWHESPLFTDQEKAILLWTETLTHLPPKGVSNETYTHVRQHLTEQELSDLSMLIVAINGWNRLGVAFQNTPGSADALFGLDRANLN
jgi:AhpD family alkylhydroperoxidase